CFSSVLEFPVPYRIAICISGFPIGQLFVYLQDSMTKIYSDGAINYLEMGRCPALQGSNKLRVVAQNQLGQTEAETVLTVVLAEDFRPDLKHVQPDTEMKARLYRSPEVIEAEKMLDQLALNLRKAEIKRANSQPNGVTSIHRNLFRSVNLENADFDLGPSGVEPTRDYQPDVGVKVFSSSMFLGMSILMST
ncbi:hypothetical protein AHF37_10443, partial [Paragonimus kellicotti]